jgi:hypothetical protein
MTKQITLISGAAAISKAVASIKNRGAKLDADIQLAGVSILAHIEQHHNVTLLNDLLLALPKGARKNALAEWAMANGQVKLNEGPTRKDVPFLYAKERITSLDKAWEKPWYDYAPTPDLIQTFDVQAAVAKILKQVANARKQNPDVEVKGENLLEQLAAMGK